MLEMPDVQHSVGKEKQRGHREVCSVVVLLLLSVDLVAKILKYLGLYINSDSEFSF